MSLDKDKILSAAAKYIDKDQYEKAVREYQKILDVEPDNARVLLYVAQCYEKSGNSKEAGQAYAKVSFSYRAQGAYQKSLAVLKQAQRHLPDDDDIAVGMAELYNALGLPHEAVAQLEKCLARSERAQNQRDYVRILQMMVRVDSENIQTRAKYAEALSAGGDVDGARRQYTLALAQLQSKDKFEEYIVLAKRFLSTCPKDTEVIRELGQVYFRLEKYNEAVQVLTSLSSKERTTDIRELLISCYSRLKRRSDAAEELKALARQLTEMGGRPDMIEDAWLRARRYAPDDLEIAEALGDDPPMLSESAINAVIIPVEDLQPARPTEPVARPVQPDISYAERMLQSKYNQALEAYRQGQVDRARNACLQIIDSNEQYQPALLLMIDICSRQGDATMLAQIERKFARAVVDQDREEALQHILNAEKCTPKAWENYNLMLVLGFDPSQYGMSAADSTHSSFSNSRIPAQKLRSTAAATPVAPPPVAPPPVPPRPRTKSIAITGNNAANLPGANIPPRPPAPPVQAPQPAINKPVTPNGQYQFKQIDLASGNQPIIEENSKDFEALGENVSDELDDLFDFMVRPGGAKAAPKHEALRVFDEHQEPGAQPVPVQRNKIPSTPIQNIAKPQSHETLRSVEERPEVPEQPVTLQRRRVPSISIPNVVAPAPSVEPTRKRVPSISIPVVNIPAAPQQPVQPQSSASPRNPIAGLSPIFDTQDSPVIEDKPVVNSTCLYMNAVPGVALSTPSRTMNAAKPGNISIQPRVVMPASAPAAPVARIVAPAQIPDSERQRVTEAIQEIDFYASLSLMDDALRLLNDLIEEFGDIDIIHDAKEKLEASA